MRDVSQTEAEWLDAGPPPITPEQCLAARRLLGWDILDLTRASGVNHVTIADFEGSDLIPPPETLAAVRRALEDAGAPLTGRGAESPEPSLGQAVRPDEPRLLRCRAAIRDWLRLLAAAAAPPARGFLAGLLAALTFRRATLFLLGPAGLGPPPSPGPKLDPDQSLLPLVTAALWGGACGSLLALLLPRRSRGVGYWIAGGLLGGAIPTLAAAALVAWSVGPAAIGSDRLGAALAFLVNVAWGLGAAILLLLI